ncbi:NADH dehydrogenase [ubiquinone] 1 beta subcomplex subunit 5, mitochondrial [Schistocerca cancellata]|uniref:NADH dehydrogenase [ubiquinone] 1 beta subcomplex subunit 5, mitochondrial n=1 Tax=Schistocerca cancellata TaxID=274614 RepID=UPI002118DDD5|nr:NADH dehydrogenase [ubiquinone] 1 beta subcomplex subunit 5, mitochondrial [Schistocerca cancellata]
MVVWSSLSTALLRVRPNIVPATSSALKNFNSVPIRCMSGHGPRTMPLQPSRFQWNKYKDLLHFYIFLGAIPVGLIIFFTNVFVGPATLAEIPEGYEPKHWEYFRHPITRFLARYLFPNPQQEYEKFLHYSYEEDEKAKIRKLEKEIKAKMAERSDYQAYYYRPAIAKYHRISKEASNYLESLRGD